MPNSRKNFEILNFEKQLTNQIIDIETIQMTHLFFNFFDWSIVSNLKNIFQILFFEKNN